MADRLKVLLLIPHLGGGGAEQVTAQLARGLSDRKYEVHLGLVTQRAVPVGAMPATVTVHALGASRVRWGALGILWLVRRLKPEVILSGMFHLNFVVLMLRPLFPRRTKVIVRQNSTISSFLRGANVPWYTRWFYRALYRFADRIVCQSRAMADDLAAELGVAAERLAVLPNPIDLTELLHMPAPATWPALGPKLLAVGRLAREKGFDVLLKAVALVRRDFPHASLIVVGKGPEEAGLKALAREFKIDDAVSFAGYVDRPWQFYAGADIFVLSSSHEGMPNALIEAMACGLPVVATRASGGVVDLLSGRADAWLARDMSVEAMASALTAAIEFLETGDSHWDRHRPEESARTKELMGGVGVIAEPESISAIDAGSGIEAGPRVRRFTEFAGEFEFERGVEAYEALIDAVCAEGGE